MAIHLTDAERSRLRGMAKRPRSRKQLYRAEALLALDEGRPVEEGWRRKFRVGVERIDVDRGLHGQAPGVPGQIRPCRDWESARRYSSAIGDERPAIVLALLDQVQLVAAARAMLDLPQFAGGRKRQAIGRADAAGPGFRGRQVGAGKGIGADHLRRLGGFGVAGRIDQRNGGRAGLAEVGIAGGGFAVQRQAQDLAYGLVRILGGSEALAVANREEQILAVGREGDLPRLPGRLCPWASGATAPRSFPVWPTWRWRSAWRGPAPGRRHSHPARHR